MALWDYVGEHVEIETISETFIGFVQDFINGEDNDGVNSLIIRIDENLFEVTEQEIKIIKLVQ